MFWIVTWSRGRCVVLRAQHAMEVIGNFVAQVQKRRALQLDRRAPAERHDTLHRAGQRRDVTRQSRKIPTRLRLALRRDGVEKGDVRLEIVALGREILVAKIGEAAVQVGRQPGREDQGRTARIHISPRSRRSLRQAAALRLCSANVSAKTCPPAAIGDVIERLGLRRIKHGGNRLAPGIGDRTDRKAGDGTRVVGVFVAQLGDADTASERLTPGYRIDRRCVGA